MMKMITSKQFLIAGFILFLLISNGDALEFNFQIKDNKISIEANKVPLKKILEKMASTDIKIYADPEINPRISALFQNRDLEDGLKSIFKSINHILVWKSFKDRPGQFKLVEVKIFKEGKKDRMIPIQRKTQNEVLIQKPEIKVIIKRNKVFVPVILGYNGREVKTTLVFDTGADSIVLHENVADELGIDDFRYSKARGVGGVEIDTKVTRLEYVKVGPYKKQNLLTSIVEYSGPKIQYYNGVLGMNFLRGLKYSIDFEKQTIKWGMD